MINYCQQVIPKDTFLVVNTKLEKSSRFKRELRNNSSICKNKLLNICHIHNESPSISCPWTGSPGTHCPFGLKKYRNGCIVTSKDDTQRRPNWWFFDVIHENHKMYNLMLKSGLRRPTVIGLQEVWDTPA